MALVDAEAFEALSALDWVLLVILRLLHVSPEVGLCPIVVV